jgi:hypothetical protein
VVEVKNYEYISNTGDTNIQFLKNSTLRNSLAVIFDHGRLALNKPILEFMTDCL